MRAEAIFNTKEYSILFEKLQELEKDRAFCNHTLEHFLDVARLMYIKFLEDSSKEDKGSYENDIDAWAFELPAGEVKDLIYATALMHDIGRVDQIENGISHEEASCIHCDEILLKCGYNQLEIKRVKAAIGSHRNKTGEISGYFSRLLYWADKKSRNCFNCKEINECNWNRDKMNSKIDY